MTSSTKAPVKFNRPTLLGLAAVADAAGLQMLSNEFLRAHDEAIGVFADGRAAERFRMAALGVIEKAIKVWEDAVQTEFSFGAGRTGATMTRIQKALGMLEVARALLGK